jgi:hypothetical protein
VSNNDQSCPLLALSEQSSRAGVCPLLDKSGQNWNLARDGLSAYTATIGCVRDPPAPVRTLLVTVNDPNALRQSRTHRVVNQRSLLWSQNLMGSSKAEPLEPIPNFGSRFFALVIGFLPNGRTIMSAERDGIDRPERSNKENQNEKTSHTIKSICLIFIEN